MAPCIFNHIGSSTLAGRDTLIRSLEQIAAGQDAFYEIARRRKVARLVGELRRDRLERSQLVVEAPTVVNQEFENLPPGVRLEPGRITVEFRDPQQALEKLLALAMAISNNFDRFERHHSDRLTPMPHVSQFYTGLE